MLKLAPKALAVAVTLSVFVVNARMDSRTSAPWKPLPNEIHQTNFVAPGEYGVFVHKNGPGGSSCVGANQTQSNTIRARQIGLFPLATNSPSPQTGLRIVLRGTQQLQNFPAAVGAFIRAASIWEARIRTIETIVIDVDYGPTLFGNLFDSDVLAEADTQSIRGNSLYPAVRERLASGPYSVDRRILYRSLPTGSVPTDQGPSQGISTTSASLRALNLLSAVADPEEELGDFGLPPAIGLNSAFAFDLDPGDGTDQDKIDFESIVLHQMGHILGFVSSVGDLEMNPSPDVAPSALDVYRFRPSETKGDFGSTERVLASGGDQGFFAGGSVRSLSTGRADGTGGDGRAASHWKDQSATGQYLGIMEPTVGLGEHQYISDDDLAALNAIGYRTRPLVDSTTVVPLGPSTPQAGSILAPPPGLGVLSHTQYSIIVPAGATQLRIDLNGNQDVDLYVRFGTEVVNQGHAVVADFRAATDSSSESLTIDASSSPALDQGIYYLAVGNFGPGDVDFTITATPIGGAVGSSPAIFNIGSQLLGDALHLDCAAVDTNSDLSMAEVAILDQSGAALIPPSRVSISSVTSKTAAFPLEIAGMNNLPTARLASVTLVDQAGNYSVAVSVDFGKSEPGGLALNGGTFTGSKLKLKVRGTTTALSVEINGVVVGASHKIKLNTTGTKLTIKGRATDLALRSGPNRIRVRNASGWSNILVVLLT
jgi:hypothetical protein